MRAVDTDNVTSLRATASASVEGGIKVVSGRIKISNAHGSELLSLPIAVTVQYWNGTTYMTSSTDSVSSFAATSVSFTNCQKLTAVSTWLTACPPPTPTPASVVFVNGIGSFTLAAPGAGKTGSVDITTSIPSYLPSNKARASFGVFKGANEFIYLRENY
jgi:MSHA biogenesis protein MshQ